MNNNNPISKVINALDIGGYLPKQKGNHYLALCPAHDDHKPSLSISQGNDGKVLLKCFSHNCKAKQIVQAIGLTESDLFMPSYSNGNKRPYTASRHATNSKAGNSKPAITYLTPQAAAKELTKRLKRKYGNGQCTKIHKYYDQNKKHICTVIRWDYIDAADNPDKTYRPVSLIDNTWQIKAMPASRPLYNLPELSSRPDEPVYIVEGEKCADSAISCGLLTVTSAGGNNAADKTNWAVLSGRQVVLLPDNDDAGQKYVDDVLEQLGKLDNVPQAKVLDLTVVEPGLSDKGDIADIVSGCKDDTDLIGLRESIEMAIDDLEPVELPKPQPADSVITALRYEPFPTQVLPDVLSQLISQGAKANKCYESFIALPALAVVAASIGVSRNITLKKSWQEPAILWTAIVGESGSGKSPAFNLALEPLQNKQSLAFERHQQELQLYEQEHLEYERDIKAYKSSKTSEPIQEPLKPICQRHTADNTTIEALAPILRDNPRGLLLKPDELNQWLGSFGAYKSGKGADESNWLSLYNGNSITIDRKTSEFIHIDKTALSITGGIQPGTLKAALGVKHIENGLAARLFMTLPPRKAKSWTEAVISQAVKDKYKRLIDSLLALEPQRTPEGRLKPVSLALLPEAKKIWIDFYNRHDKERIEQDSNLAAAWAKLEAGAARLALIIQLAGNPQSTQIGLEAVQAGITLADWFGNEAKRIYARFGETEQDQSQRELIELIKRKGGDVSARELKQSNWAYRKLSTADIEQELVGLVEAGLGNWQQPAQDGRGKPKARRFIINDKNNFKTINSINIYDNTVFNSDIGDTVDVDVVDDIKTNNYVNVDLSPKLAGNMPDSLDNQQAATADMQAGASSDLMNLLPAENNIAGCLQH